MSALSDIVAKFRKASPNIAAAFDETKRLLGVLEAGSAEVRADALAAVAALRQELGAVDGELFARLDELEARIAALEPVVDPPPPPPPPPPPSSSLPFAEAQLRPGYAIVTVPNPTTTSYTTPSGVDVLIDLQWVRREQALKVYVRGGQRVHIKNAWVDSTSEPGNARGLSAYWRGGLGVRMLAGETVGADHVSITGYLASGKGLTDGFTIGGTNDTASIKKVTLQNFRIENASMSNGGKASSEASEHMDCFQAQGPFDRLELGHGVMCRQWTPSGSHPGKGLMLNAYAANGRMYTVALTRVLFRDFPGATGCGAVWIKDVNTIRLELDEVYSLIEGSPSGSWAWTANSGLFLSTASQGGTNQGWTSSGTAPARTASFPTAANVSGVVREGLPAGGDFVTRQTLGVL